MADPKAFQEFYSQQIAQKAYDLHLHAHIEEIKILANLAFNEGYFAGYQEGWRDSLDKLDQNLDKIVDEESRKRKQAKLWAAGNNHEGD